MIKRKKKLRRIKNNQVLDHKSHKTKNKNNKNKKTEIERHNL